MKFQWWSSCHFMRSDVSKLLCWYPSLKGNVDLYHCYSAEIRYGTIISRARMVQGHYYDHMICSWENCDLGFHCCNCVPAMASVPVVATMHSNNLGSHCYNSFPRPYFLLLQQCSRNGLRSCGLPRQTDIDRLVSCLCMMLEHVEHLTR
jgi:hypothetical protein